MVSVSGGGASFSPSETLEEKRRKEELEAEQAKKQEQNTASDTQSAVSAAQNSKDQTAQARTSLPGTNGTTQSSDTASDTTPKKEANPASQEPKKPSIQLFDTVPTDPARSASQQHEVDEAIKSFQAEKKANDQKVKELDQRLVEMQDQIGKYNELTIKTKDRKYDSLRAVESQKLHALKDSEEYKQAQEKKAQIKARENLISSLIQAGDLKGAKAVAEGKEHTKETEINLQNLQLSPTPPHPEHQNLPPALGQVLDFKKNLDEDIKSRKENLQLLRSQHEELIKGIRHQGIGSVPIEQITKLKEDIAQETRELETRNQVQERIAKLIDEGNIEEAQKLVTGKEKLKVKEIFNKDIKDTSSLDKKSSESVQEMLIKKAVELEKREKEIKQLDIDGNKLKEQIGSLQEKIEATQKDYERSLGYSRKEGYSYETNKSKELAKQKQALKENLQKAQNELKKNTDRSRALNQSAREDLLNLVDAAKLAQQGELDTAKNLINGKTQKQNEILNITNESTNGLINPDKERELGTDKYNQELSQNFRDLILDQIQAQQKQLVILNNYMKDAQRVLDDPSIPDRKITVDIPGKNPGDPPQKKETMLREHIRSEMMASEIKRRELQKSANQLQQLHTKLTELQSQGDFTTTRSIIEGKQSIVTEQIYGAKDADLEATASKDYARTPQESEDLSKKLLVEMTKAHQSALSRLQNAKASELPQEQIKQAQDEVALTRREITHINELIKSNKFEEAIDFSRKHLPLRQASRETFTQNANAYFNQERESFEKWDYAYGVGETVSKTAGYVAVGAAAAAATGGVALAYGAGYGTLLLAVGAGTAAGTSAGAILEAGRAGIAMTSLGGSHTANEAFEGYLGKVGEHAQNALIDSIGTATGLKVAQVLTKPGASTLLKITANAAGGLAESGTSFTINTGISRYQAQEEYERTKPDISYEEFLKQKGLDNASLVKNGLVDMAVSTIIGARTGYSEALEDTMQAAQRAIGRELADSAQKRARRELTDHGFSLATELTGDFIKNGGSFSVEGVTQAILGAPVETLTSQIRAKVANRNNNNNTNADTQTSSQTKRNSDINPTITEDPNLTVDAQTRRLESADGSQVEVEISARPEILSPTTKEARAKLAEEYIHAQQQNIDSFETNPDGSIKTDAQGKPVTMDQTENLARRSLNELRARLAGQYDSLTRDLESTTDAQKKADLEREIENTIIQQGEKLNQLESLIADASQKKESGAKADFTKALEFAKNNGITEADINLFLDDYQKNSSRNLDSDQLINRYNSSGLKTESEYEIARGNTIAELDSMIHNDAGQKASPEAIQAKLQELELEALDQTTLDTIQKLLNDAREAGIDTSKIDGIDDIATAKYLKENYGIEFNEANGFKNQLNELGIEKVQIKFGDFEGEGIKIKLRDAEGNIIENSSTTRLSNDTIRRLEARNAEGGFIPGNFFIGSKIQRFIDSSATSGKIHHTRGASIDEIQSTNNPIYITESILKANRLAQLVDDGHVIGTNGVSAFTKNGRLNPDFELMNLDDREVRLIPDGDYQTNEQVRNSINNLARELETLGAKVKIVDLSKEIPEQPGAGIDDVLKHYGDAARRRLDDLLTDPQRNIETNNRSGSPTRPTDIADIYNLETLAQQARRTAEASGTDLESLEKATQGQYEQKLKNSKINTGKLLDFMNEYLKTNTDADLERVREVLTNILNIKSNVQFNQKMTEFLSDPHNKKIFTKFIQETAVNMIKQYSSENNVSYAQKMLSELEQFGLDRTLVESQDVRDMLALNSSDIAISDIASTIKDIDRLKDTMVDKKGIARLDSLKNELLIKQIIDQANPSSNSVRTLEGLVRDIERQVSNANPENPVELKATIEGLRNLTQQGKNKNNSDMLTALDKLTYLQRKIEAETLPGHERTVDHNVVDAVESLARNHETATGEKLGLDEKLFLEEMFRSSQDLTTVSQALKNFQHQFGEYLFDQLVATGKIEKVRQSLQERELAYRKQKEGPDAQTREISDTELQAYLGKARYRMILADGIKNISDLMGTPGLRQALQYFHTEMSSVRRSTAMEQRDRDGFLGRLNELNTAGKYQGKGHDIVGLGLKPNGTDIDLMHRGTIKFDDGDVTGLFFSEVKSSFKAVVDKYLNETGAIDLDRESQYQRLMEEAKGAGAELVINIDTKAAVQVDAQGKATGIKVDETGGNTQESISEAYNLVRALEGRYNQNRAPEDHINIRIVDENSVDIRAIMQRITENIK